MHSESCFSLFPKTRIFVHASSPRLIKRTKQQLTSIDWQLQRQEPKFPYSHPTSPGHTEKHQCVLGTYFAARKEQEQQRRQAEIRNVAVIAHVDHGKTTLSDALLLKAGLLHKDRAGDQSKGLLLDSTKDEQERGITIKSAAITLPFSVRESVVNNGPYANIQSTDKSDVSDYSASEDASEDEVIDVYVGNLPRDFSKQQLEDFLVDKGVDGVVEICFHARRSYAIVSIQERFLSKMVSLSMRTVGDCDLIIELTGDSPMKRLLAACQVQHASMPNLEAKKTTVDDFLQKFSGVAHWQALGDVIIQAPGLYDSRKEARQAVAEECIQFLQRQQQNHLAAQRDVLNTQGSSSSQENLVSSCTTDMDSCASDAGVVPIVVNLIDTPGHIEFNAEVTAALRVSDGALIVVDAIEGKATQTEEVLAQALREGVKPILMLNKVDRLFLDRRYTAEEAYDCMKRIVDDINGFIAVHQLDHFPNQQVSFGDGSVCIGSGYFGWSCSVDTFIKKENTQDEYSTLRRHLSKRENFIKYILKPIIRMHRVCGVLPMKKEHEKINRVEKVNELLSERIQGWTGKRLLPSNEDASTIEPRKLLKNAMMAWLPAAEALVDMIAAHVPSPIFAQRMRADILYSGDLTDSAGRGIQTCDPDGPAVVYISKMSPSPVNSKKLLAFGRVFSGTIRAGDTLRAIRTNGTERNAKVGQVKMCGIGSRMTVVPYAEAGEMIVLEGIDGALNKAGTLTSASDGMPIRHLNFSVAPVVQHSVRPKDKRDLTRMVKEFNNVVNADSAALFYKDNETGCYILAGTGDLHIEVLVSSFIEKTKIEIELSEPIIAYRETVQSSTVDAALAKSDNKHNRIWFKASPLTSECIAAISSGELANLDHRSLGKVLTRDLGWSSSDASRVWAVGPEPTGLGDDAQQLADRPTCLLVDDTFGLQIPDDARANIVSAFKQVTREGVLVNSPMWGVRFDLVDAKFHQDSMHRRPNSVVPAAARAMRGAFLMAEASLMEPMFRVDISGGSNTLNSTYAVIGNRGGSVSDVSSTKTLDAIQAFVPVRRSFGLVGELRLASQGHAQCTCAYSGMRLVPSQEQDDIVSHARSCKKLHDKLPTAEQFVDKL